MAHLFKFLISSLGKIGLFKNKVLTMHLSDTTYILNKMSGRWKGGKVMFDGKFCQEPDYSFQLVGCIIYWEKDTTLSELDTSSQSCWQRRPKRNHLIYKHKLNRDYILTRWPLSRYLIIKSNLKYVFFLQ